MWFLVGLIIGFTLGMTCTKGIAINVVKVTPKEMEEKEKKEKNDE